MQEGEKRMRVDGHEMTEEELEQWEEQEEMAVLARENYLHAVFSGVSFMK